jgi:hypothetical protein
MLGHLFLTLALLGQADTAEKAKTPPPVEDEARQKLRREVEKLERDILRGDLNQRERATQKLIELGPDVLEVLRASDSSTPAELKLVRDNVRKQLEKQVAEAAAKPTLITLKGEMPLSQVMDALQKQSGHNLIDSRERRGQPKEDPKIKVNFAKTPFWDAMDQVLDAAKLIYDYPDLPGVAYVAREPGQQMGRAVAYTGPLRVEVVKIAAERNLRASSGHRLELDLELFWEPSLSPVHVAIPMSSIAAVDENGKSLEVAQRGSVEQEIPLRTLYSELSLPFVAPSRDAKKVSLLKGKLDLLVLGRIGTFEFTKLERDQKERRTQSQSGVDVILEGVRQNGEVWQARVIVAFKDAEGALASHRDWVLNNETYILDSSGKKITYDGLETFKRTENEIGVAYNYDLEKGPNGLTLIYKTPSVIMNVPLDFEIKDLDLP